MLVRVSVRVEDGVPAGAEVQKAVRVEARAMTLIRAQ